MRGPCSHSRVTRAAWTAGQWAGCGFAGRRAAGRQWREGGAGNRSEDPGASGDHAREVRSGQPQRRRYRRSPRVSRGCSAGCRPHPRPRTPSHASRSRSLRHAVRGAVTQNWRRTGRPAGCCWPRSLRDASACSVSPTNSARAAELSSSWRPSSASCRGWLALCPARAPRDGNLDPDRGVTGGVPDQLRSFVTPDDVDYALGSWRRKSASPAAAQRWAPVRPWLTLSPASVSA